jgi:hypothetical protein
VVPTNNDGRELETGEDERQKVKNLVENLIDVKQPVLSGLAMLNVTSFGEQYPGMAEVIGCNG